PKDLRLGASGQDPSEYLRDCEILGGTGGPPVFLIRKHGRAARATNKFTRSQHENTGWKPVPHASRADQCGPRPTFIPCTGETFRFLLDTINDVVFVATLGASCNGFTGTLTLIPVVCSYPMVPVKELGLPVMGLASNSLPLRNTSIL